MFKLFLLNHKQQEQTKSATFWCWCILLVVFGQATSTALVYLYDLPPMPLLSARSPASINEYYRLLYIKPHYWMSSYLIGALLAVYMRERTSTSVIKNTNLARKSSAAISVATLTVMLCLILSNLFFFLYEIPMSPIYAGVYSFLVRPAWSLCLCVVIVSLGPPVHDNCQHARCSSCRQRNRRSNLISGKLLASTSRLSYSAYLLHPIVMASFYGSREETFHLSSYLMLYFTLGHIVLTYFGAFCLYVLVEAPLQRLIGASKWLRTGR